MFIRMCPSVIAKLYGDDYFKTMTQLKQRRAGSPSGGAEGLLVSKDGGCNYTGAVFLSIAFSALSTKEQHCF